MPQLCTRLSNERLLSKVASYYNFLYTYYIDVLIRYDIFWNLISKTTEQSDMSLLVIGAGICRHLAKAH